MGACSLIQEDLELVKRFFNNKESQGKVELNGEDVIEAFSRIYEECKNVYRTTIEDKPS